MKRSIRQLEEYGFCKYCFETGMIWVIDMAATQVADKPNFKQLTGINNELLRLYEEGYPFIEEFLDKYAQKYLLPKSIQEVVDMAYMPK